MSLNRLPIALPVDQVVPEFQKHLAHGFDVILKASPGSGKTTRIPPAAAACLSGEIWVLEPRRLAARTSAQRVAFEYGEAPGQRVGWQMRFDRCMSKETKILFLTEGMFLAKLGQNPNLAGVSCVILDEFHERHLQTDVALALTSILKKTSRPDLRLVIMSATLEDQPLREKFPDSKFMDVTAPVFPVGIEHRSSQGQGDLLELAAREIQRVVTSPQYPTGHVLVFLPGTGEILKLKNKLLSLLPQENFLLLELRGSLDQKTQDLVFAETPKRKIILSTNIAESALTIPGVTIVVDSGLARVPSFNLFTGLSTLETKAVSQSSLIQRAGRAGRTAPGFCIRLFSPHEEAMRPQNEIPELLRSDLTGLLFSLLGLRERIRATWQGPDLPWFTAPDKASWDHAVQLLKELNLVDEHLNVLRPELTRLPLHPRLSKLGDECVKLSFEKEAPWLLAILEQQDTVQTLGEDFSYLENDLLAKYEVVRRNPGRFSSIRQIAKQIHSILCDKDFCDITEGRPAHELELEPAFFAAFPDRVMKLRETSSKHKKNLKGTLCDGSDVELSNQSSASHCEWVIALDASSTKHSGSVAQWTNRIHYPQEQVLVSLAMGLSLDLILNSSSRLLQETETSSWDEKFGKLRRFKQISYGRLSVLTQALADAPTGDQQNTASSKDLFNYLTKNWPKPFADESALTSYLTRQELLKKHALTDHAWDLQELRSFIISFICDETDALHYVSSISLEDWIRRSVGEEEFSLVTRLAPSKITLKSGFKVDVHYPSEAPPWIEARLQNFFGQTDTPKILDGRLGVTVHLLGPNMRALQVTGDLKSFWSKTYPTLRNEYMRRYPRHSWPEDPLNAEPPPPRKPRS